jgi:hypothetical protein
MEGPRHAGVAMMQQPQKSEEGRGWANINPAAAPNTYTGKGGSKRD